MKRLYSLILLLSFSVLSAQTVKSKKEIVYVDDKPTFSFSKKAMGNEIHIYKLNTKEELLRMVTETYGTESKVDDGKKVFFAAQNTTIQSKTFRGKDWDTMISLLLEEKVINLNGEINPDNLKRFKSKYDDGNINHLNKY